MGKKIGVFITKNTAFIASIAGTFMLFVFLSFPVSAAVKDVITNATSETGILLGVLSGGITTIKTPGQVVANVVQIILGFLGLVGVIMMLYAGFLWLTAGGEEEKAKKGRTLLFQALIGILIVLAAYSVTYFVLQELTKAVAG